MKNSILFLVLIFPLFSYSQPKNNHCPKDKVNFCIDAYSYQYFKDPRHRKNFGVLIGLYGEKWNASFGLEMADESVDPFMFYNLIDMVFQVVDTKTRDSTFYQGEQMIVITTTTNIWDSVKTAKSTLLLARYSYIHFPLRFNYSFLQFKKWEFFVSGSLNLICENKREIEWPGTGEKANIIYYGVRSKKIFVNCGAGLGISFDLFKFNKSKADKGNPLFREIELYDSFFLEKNDRFSKKDNNFNLSNSFGIRFKLF